MTQEILDRLATGKRGRGVCEYLCGGVGGAVVLRFFVERDEYAACDWCARVVLKLHPLTALESPHWPTPIELYTEVCDAVLSSDVGGAT